MPAAIKAMIDSTPVTQRWPRREKASTIITITPATLTIASGAISEKLRSGLAAWNAKNIFCVKQREYFSIRLFVCVCDFFVLFRGSSPTENKRSTKSHEIKTKKHELRALSVPSELTTY